jgi:hypothetical protein
MGQGLLELYSWGEGTPSIDSLSAADSGRVGHHRLGWVEGMLGMINYRD